MKAGGSVAGTQQELALSVDLLPEHWGVGDSWRADSSKEGWWLRDS